MRIRKRAQAKIDFPISSMIDCTFLLLIYFMVASSFHRQEADISFSLPGVAEQSEPLAMPDEQILEIEPDGAIVLNAANLDSPSSRELPELRRTLVRFREMSAAAKTEAMLTINAADDTLHQRVVDVLNACADARLANVTFAFDGEENE
ncbi:biopolymer transporter ExbD [bacterium]|nr:biopolymer transporter ExbD [bacterium]